MSLFTRDHGDAPVATPHTARRFAVQRLTASGWRNLGRHGHQLAAERHADAAHHVYSHVRVVFVDDSGRETKVYQP